MKKRQKKKLIKKRNQAIDKLVNLQFDSFKSPLYEYLIKKHT